MSKAAPPPEEPKKSNVRICQTCSGNGTVDEVKKVKMDGVTQTVTTTKKCPAGCNNGAINIRNI